MREIFRTYKIYLVKINKQYKKKQLGNAIIHFFIFLKFAKFHF